MKIPLVSGLIAKLKPSDRANSDTQAATTTKQPAQWNDESLELTLGSLLTNQESKSLGTVQAITLADFRDSVGGLWEQYEKNILLIAETTIDRSLGKGQTVIQQDSETWLLVTPDLTPAEAERFAANIASSIGEKLIGARFETEEDTDPTPETGMVDLIDALDSDGSINRAAIQNAVANARAAIAAKKARRIRERIKSNDVKSAQTKPEAKDRERLTGAEKGLKLSYWPCWTAESQSIDTFVCRPIGQDGRSPFEREDLELISANAIAVARAGAVALNSMVKDGVRAKLVVPIPLAALLSTAQRQIIQALEKLQEKQRFLYLRPEIVRIPHSVSTSALLTGRDVLRPLARDVGVLTDLFQPNKAVLSVSGMIIGCDAGKQVTTSASDLQTALTAFKTSVQPRSSYVIGLSDSAAVKHAANIGFSEVGGPALRDRLRRTPQSTEPFTTDEIISEGTESDFD